MRRTHVKKTKIRRNKTKGGYADTHTVVAFSFITFVLALSIPAKLALAQAAYSMESISTSIFDGMANAIAATPAFSLFALGFVSATLVLGVVWDKFSFDKIILAGARKKSGRRATRRGKRGGFISLELASMSILSLLLISMISSPVFT